MRKVFIPQLPTRFDKATNQRVPSVDTNPAAQFGELVTMFGPEESRAGAIAAVNAGRGDDIGASDCVLAVGDVALLATILVRAIRRNGRATLLRWDAETRTYRMEEIKA